MDIPGISTSNKIYTDCYKRTIKVKWKHHHPPESFNYLFVLCPIFMVVWYCVCVWECCIMGSGLGRAWLPRPRLVTVDTTNTSTGHQPQPGRRERERASEEYFTQRQNPAQLLLTAPPWGCSTVRKHFIHFITFLTHTVEMGKWQCLFGKCWRGQFSLSTDTDCYLASSSEPDLHL